MAEITEEELLVQKEAMQLFNDSVNGKVNSMELGRLLKSLGCIKTRPHENIQSILYLCVEFPPSWCPPKYFSIFYFFIKSKTNKPYDEVLGAAQLIKLEIHLIV